MMAALAAHDAVVSSLAPLNSLVQDDWSEVRHDLFGHMTTGIGIK